MEKKFKEMITEAKRSLKKIEKSIEERSEDFSEEVNDFWTDLKKKLSDINGKLDDAYDEYENKVKLKSHLAMIEARESIKKLEDVAYEFSKKVSENSLEELDIIKLRAHLLKMESNDIWEEKEKELVSLFEHSKDEAEKLTIKAAKEFNQIVLKLTDII
jgi:hypothetical protein